MLHTYTQSHLSLTAHTEEKEYTWIYRQNAQYASHCEVSVVGCTSPPEHHTVIHLLASIVMDMWTCYLYTRTHSFTAQQSSHMDVSHQGKYINQNGPTKCALTLSCMLISAPLSNRSFTHSKCPSLDAHISAVCPSCKD